MAATKLIPKQRQLGPNETQNTFESWKESLIFHIIIDTKLARFVDPNDLGMWGPYNETNRGFTDDAESTTADKKMTAHQKASMLKVLLGSVASYSQVISHTYITRQATSLEAIFSRLRAYYGFRRTGAMIAGALDFKLEPMESKEALWERIYTFLEGNLLTTDSGISHEGNAVTVNEEFTPTLLNLAVVIWLDTIHSGLPALVSQRFATNLRDVTLYTIRCEISDSIPSLLKELEERDGIVAYSNTRNKFSSRKFVQKPRRKCCLCEAASRPGFDNHFLSACPFLPQEDRKYMSKARIREVEYLSDDEEDLNKCSANNSKVGISVSESAGIDRVDIISSPVLQVTVNTDSAEITLDSGAEATLVSLQECKRLGLEILPTSQHASMADGISPLKTTGEVHFAATRYCPTTKRSHKLHISGLVIEKLNCPILAGMPFLVQNDVYLRPKHRSIHIGECCVVRYICSKDVKRKDANTRAASVLRVTKPACLLPGSSMELELPQKFHNKVISVEPCNMQENDNDWLPCRIKQVEESISVTNESKSPVLVRKHDQICQVRHTTELTPDDTEIVDSNKPEAIPVSITNTENINPATLVSVDPQNRLTESERNKFIETNIKHKDVFSSKLGLYNGHSGPFKHIISMGSSLPPQRRGRVPMYNRSNLELLQSKFDELYQQGVFAKPEDRNMAIEYVSPSFLVSKSSGGHRLVTAFTEIGQYAKPQPSLMPKVDDVLLQIGQWQWIIKADLKQAYFQIPLAKESMKFVGVCTPFRGVLVYTRAVMGLPGSESALEQLLCKVLGDFMVEGSVVKLADDLYIGAESPSELNIIWDKVLTALAINGLRLSPQKTVCCPKSTDILGWRWDSGKLSATPHRINSLSKCSPPTTVKALRSFIGSYKFLSNVLPRHSDLLNPLDKVCSNSKSSSEKVIWTSELEDAFSTAIEHLKEAKTLTMPRKEDKLQITTDAAATTSGLGATMYVIREKAYLAGVFNARKSGSQSGWLICELEALAIAASVKHFGPYIIQSMHTTEVLTDSRPCVQSYQKLQRGAFSASPRVTTFLSAISRYHVKLSHISGKDNIAADSISRNPLTCDGLCQICQFVNKTENSVVNEVSVSDILSGRASVPYTTRATWIRAQQDCNDLRHVYKLLKDGRTPSKKKKGLTDVRRYLQQVKMSTSPNDGLLVVPVEEPLKRSRQKIVVPRGVLEGLLTAMHLQLYHPTKYQLRQVFNRGFFGLDVERAVSNVVDGCHTCASLKNVPSIFKEQSTTKPPDRIGRRFSMDVIKRDCQLILIMREDVSAYTEGIFIQSESATSLRDGLVRISGMFRPPTGPEIVVRVDAATGFQAIKEDPALLAFHIILEQGEIKNKNSNAVAERAISDFHKELTRLKPSGGRINDVELSLILANMNSRIRQSGYTAYEVWTKRDMHTGKDITINDDDLIAEKFKSRQEQHAPSAKYKSRGATKEKLVDVSVGDIVYLYLDRDKCKGRNMYMVMETDSTKHCYIQKLIDRQFRGKRYKVHITDVIKVPPHVYRESFESDTSESDEELLPVNTGIREGNNEPDEGQSSDDTTRHDSTDEDEADTTEETVADVDRPRPRRTREIPKHLRDYVMGSP